MHPYYPAFLKLVNQENKDEAMIYVLNLLKEKKIELYDLYDFFLRPVLNEFECTSEDEAICIWKEHVRTSIVRTILESTYPYLIEIKKTVEKNHQKVMVVCPSEEFHEVGAIIVTNYFSLAGFDAQYIGANTPKNDILSAVKALKPDYLALSVTNYYNLVVTKQITEQVKGLYPNVKIIVGGNAFNKPGALDHLVYDYHLTHKEDIFKLGGNQ
jgi:MerR family transcriptional regulator, light-induced transcriptional regulator